MLTVAAARARLRVALALAVLLLGGTWPASARAETVMKVLVLEPVDRDLVQRIQGQLADRGTHVITGPGSGETAVKRAYDAASRRGPALVVWFSPPPRFAVSVLDVRRNRLVERELPAAKPGEVMAESARAEAAAFIVRSAVEDLLDGHEAGREITPPETWLRDPCSAVKVEPRPPPPRWHALAGAHLVADGVATLLGPELGLLYRRERLSVGGSATLSYSSTVDRAGFSLDVARYDLRGFASYGLLTTPQVELLIGAELGPSLYRRTTRSAPAGFTPAPSSHEPALFFGVFAAAGWRLTATGVRLQATLGVEATPGQRELLVRGRPGALDTAWPLQPTAQLSGSFPLW